MIYVQYDALGYEQGAWEVHYRLKLRKWLRYKPLHIIYCLGLSGLLRNRISHSTVDTARKRKRVHLFCIEKDIW